MTRPSFLEGAALALAASIGGSILYGSLDYLLGPGLAARLLIPALGLAYLLYVLVRSEARVGRLVSLVGWLLLAVAAWLLSLPLSLYLPAHVGAIWLLRALYFYPSPLPALADLGLQGLALAAALWALAHTASPLLGIWCFFLVQALFVPLAAGRAHQERDPEDRFQRAYASADAALRKLSSNHR
jgi:hypothetical protein